MERTVTYYRKESRTSKDSAFAQDYESLQKSVYFLLKRNDLAVFEIASILGKEQHSINPRVNELLEMGLVQKTGKVIRNPETNRDAEIWTAKKGEFATIKKKTVNKKNNIRDALICLKQCNANGEDADLIYRAIQLLEMK